MGGIKLRLDTHFVIGVLKGSGAVQAFMSDRPVPLKDCAYSFITRIELLGFPSITAAETARIEGYSAP